MGVRVLHQRRLEDVPSRQGVHDGYGAAPHFLGEILKDGPKSVVKPPQLGETYVLQDLFVSVDRKSLIDEDIAHYVGVIQLLYGLLILVGDHDDLKLIR